MTTKFQLRWITHRAILKRGYEINRARIAAALRHEAATAAMVDAMRKTSRDWGTVSIQGHKVPCFYDVAVLKA